MTSAFTAAADFRQGLYEAAVTAIDDSDVSIVTGAPSDVFAWDLVAVGREVTSDQDFGPMGTARTRNEQLTCDVTVSVLRPGGQEQESVAATRAYELLGAVELYARKTDTTLGGV